MFRSAKLHFSYRAHIPVMDTGRFPQSQNSRIRSSARRCRETFQVATSVVGLKYLQDEMTDSCTPLRSGWRRNSMTGTLHKHISPPRLRSAPTLESLASRSSSLPWGLINLPLTRLHLAQSIRHSSMHQATVLAIRCDTSCQSRTRIAVAQGYWAPGAGCRSACSSRRPREGDLTSGGTPCLTYQKVRGRIA